MAFGSGKLKKKHQSLLHTTAPSDNDMYPM